MNIKESELKLFDQLKLRSESSNLDMAIDMLSYNKNFKKILSRDLNDEKLILEINNIIDKLLTVTPSTTMIDIKYYSKYN